MDRRCSSGQPSRPPSRVSQSDDACRSSNSATAPCSATGHRLLHRSGVAAFVVTDCTALHCTDREWRCAVASRLHHCARLSRVRYSMETSKTSLESLHILFGSNFEGYRDTFSEMRQKHRQFKKSVKSIPWVQDALSHHESGRIKLPHLLVTFSSCSRSLFMIDDAKRRDPKNAKRKSDADQFYLSISLS